MNSSPIRVALALSVLGTTLPAFAQTAATAAPLQNATQPAGAQWQAIPVKNVSPHVMAWWLDPNSNPEPAEYAQSRQLPGSGTGFNPAARSGTGQTTATPPRKSNSLLDIGTGHEIQSVVAVDAQKMLLVLGTAEGLQQAKTLISYLDRPLRQVEIEAQFVEVDAATAQELGINFNTASGPFTAGATTEAPPANLALGFFRGNLQAKLNSLANQKKAKITSQPRVTTFNNMMARLENSFSVPAALGIKDEKGEFQPLPASPTTTLSLVLQTRHQFTVTPTINNDETITLVLAVAREQWLAREAPGRAPASPDQAIFLNRLDDIQSVANVKDGDTIVLGGLSQAMLPSNNPAGTTAPQAKSDNPKSHALLFITARIIRRIGEG